jgi:hypothetical protein
VSSRRNPDRETAHLARVTLWMQAEASLSPEAKRIWQAMGGGLRLCIPPDLPTLSSLPFLFRDTVPEREGDLIVPFEVLLSVAMELLESGLIRRFGGSHAGNFYCCVM